MSEGLSALSIWRRLGCCLTGHDYSITSDRTRMFVRCRSCGHASPGLKIDKDLFRERPHDESAGAAGHSSFATR
jgi:hypothetical protein